MWVVGLGNPGRRYARTRHNVGHAVVEGLAGRWGAEALDGGRSFRAWRARVGEAPAAVTLVVPLSYMNRSGEALADLAAETGARPLPGGTLVVCDDVYLPIGHLRVRAGGSTGGHRGLASVEEFFGTPEYARLRIGVGHAGGEVLSDHVLSEFDEHEEESVREALQRAEDAVETWVREGVLAAMNRFNSRVREVGP